MITLWNPGAERIFGHSADMAVGQSLDLIIPSVAAAHWRGFSEVMQTGQSRYGTGDLLSVPSIRRDGQRISLEFTIVPLKDAEGRMTGMVATLRDVTARFEELKTLRSGGSPRSNLTSPCPQTFTRHVCVGTMPGSATPSSAGSCPTAALLMSS